MCEVADITCQSFRASLFDKPTISLGHIHHPPPLGVLHYGSWMWDSVLVPTFPHVSTKRDRILTGGGWHQSHQYRCLWKEIQIDVSIR